MDQIPYTHLLYTWKTNFSFNNKQSPLHFLIHIRAPGESKIIRCLRLLTFDLSLARSSWMRDHDYQYKVTWTWKVITISLHSILPWENTEQAHFWYLCVWNPDTPVKPTLVLRECVAQHRRVMQRLFVRVNRLRITLETTFMFITPILYFRFIFVWYPLIWSFFISTLAFSLLLFRMTCTKNHSSQI